jgi:nucleotide-binding universal stress UspA family protein
MKPILLATDGSPSAEAATDEALELAQAFEAPLLVVSVAHVSVPPYGGYYGYPDVITELHATEMERVGKLLSELKDRALTAGLACETFALDGPAAGAEICRVAVARNPRLIVIGAHGWGRIGRLLHGSVSTDVLYEAPCPVLVVHGEDLVPAADLVGAKAGTAF